MTWKSRHTVVRRSTTQTNPTLDVWPRVSQLPLTLITASIVRQAWIHILVFFSDNLFCNIKYLCFQLGHHVIDMVTVFMKGLRSKAIPTKNTRDNTSSIYFKACIFTLLHQSLELVAETRILREMKFENCRKKNFLWGKNWQTYFFFYEKKKRKFCIGSCGMRDALWKICVIWGILQANLSYLAH